MLHSLQLMTVILLAGLGGATLAKVPDWAIQIISGLLIVVVVLYIFFFGIDKLTIQFKKTTANSRWEPMAVV